MKNTKTLTVASLMAALCVALHAVGSLIGTLDVSLSILSGLLIMILSAEWGDRVAFSVFLVAGLLSLLLPAKMPAIYFLGLFGYYPIIQKKIHYLRPLLARAVKLFLFNVVLGAFLVATAVVTGTHEAVWLYAVSVLFANAVFWVYDILLDRFMIFYLLKIRPRLRFK